MIWAVMIICVILIAVPMAVHSRQLPMSDDVRRSAPGHFANLASGKTHYQWHGPKNGNVFVCVHGLTTPSYVWDAIIPGVTAMGFRVLTYDLYGRGYSDRPNGVQDDTFFVTQLEELLADQSVDSWLVLMGYSMGGAIATCFGAKHPDMLERLILLAPAGFGLAPNKAQEFMRNTPVVGDWLMTVLGGRMIRQGLTKESTVPSQVPDIYARQAQETRYRGLLPAVLSSSRNILSMKLTKQHKGLAKADVPVAAIWGEADQVISMAGLGALAAVNRKARQTTIPNAPHSLAYTYPREVVAAIQEFMREV